MNEEMEQIKDKFRAYLNKKGIELESQYFILLSLVEEIKEDIFDDNDEDDEDDSFEDLESEDEDEDTTEEDVVEEEPAKSKGPRQAKPLKKPDHSIKAKELLRPKKDDNDDDIIE